MFNLNTMKIHSNLSHTYSTNIHTNQNTDSEEIEFLIADSFGIYHLDCSF